MQMYGSIDELAIYGSALSPETLGARYATATGQGCEGVAPADNEATTCVTANVVSQFAVRVDPASVSFGNVVRGRNYKVLQHVDVESNDPESGYQLSVKRSAFTPSDLQLRISCAGATDPDLTRHCAAPKKHTTGTLTWDLLIDEMVDVAKGADPATPIGRRDMGVTGAGIESDGWPVALELGVPADAAAGQYSAVVTYSAVVLP